MRGYIATLALMAVIFSIALPVCTAADDVNLGPPQIGEWDPIEMPEPHKPPALTDDTSTEPTSNNDSFLPTLIGLVVILNILAVLAILIDKKRKAGNVSMPTQATYCTKCGGPLPEGSEFCWSCGTAVRKP